MPKLEDTHIEKARKSVQQIDALRELVKSVADSTLRKEIEDLDTLNTIAEKCRYVGANKEAARIFGRISDLYPNQQRAAILRDILTGVPNMRFSGDVTPALFVQIDNFLNDALHRKLLRHVIDDLEYFNDAGVYLSDSEIARNSHGRRGKVLIDERISPYETMFLPKLKSALKGAEVFSRLGISEPTRLRIELQVTNYSDGDYFGRHVDDNISHHRNRKVSFVYYLRRAHNCFKGGDLLLYDQISPSIPSLSQSFTRIVPLNNSIVFFLSSNPHEVLPTFVDSNERRDGRFSINGWLLQNE